MNTIFDLLNPANTVAINRPLVHAIGLAEAVVYAALLAKRYYYEENGMLDEDGCFYSTVADLAESTGLSEYQQRRCVSVLVKCGLVISCMKGMPAKRYFKLVDDIELLQELIARGEEKIAELKPEAAVRHSYGCAEETTEQAPKKVQTLLQRNFGTSAEETAAYNKSKINNQKITNQKSSINLPAEIERKISEYEDRTDRIDLLDRNVSDSSEREYFLETIRENIDYDFFYENRDNRVMKIDMGKIDSIVGIMTDVLCSKSRTVRVNGADMPYNAVKERFLSLNDMHISYVIDAMRRSASDIRNIRTYLITALYNAPTTIDSYYKALVERDMRGGNTFSGYGNSYGGYQASNSNTARQVYQ